MVEGTDRRSEIFDRIARSGIRTILVINKIDLTTPERLEELVGQWRGILPDAEIVPVSALNDFNIGGLFDRILAALPEGEPFFPKDALTDKTLRFFASDFVSNVSHEFKTPISAIEGYATLLQDDDMPISEEQEQYINKILFNTRRLSHLAGNILLLSKIEHQSIQTRQNWYRLDEQIRQSIVMMEPKWSEKEIEFDVDMMDVEYLGNENLICHVWDNLLSNAIKFSPCGGTIYIRMMPEGEKIRFSIENEGPQIREDSMKHIFDKFYQCDSSHKQEGNGLGLALVKQILNLCKGTISVENIPGSGCRFTVIL